MTPGGKEVGPSHIVIVAKAKGREGELCIDGDWKEKCLKCYLKRRMPILQLLVQDTKQMKSNQTILTGHNTDLRKGVRALAMGR